MPEYQLMTRTCISSGMRWLLPVVKSFMRTKPAVKVLPGQN
ncbi:hypothetical protein CDS [Salmonella enterica subsp. enterica serovar Derby]|nr:hypothetical protein CDS [Salmonella enterica subsp. enterica serovar Derby]